MRRTVAVVPAGQWGTALAVPIARGGHDVRLWFRSSEAAEQFQRTQQNERRLPDVTLPDNVTGTANLADAVRGADVVVLASSSAGIADVCLELGPLLPDDAIVLSLIKALFAEPPRFVHEFVARQLTTASAGADERAQEAMLRRMAVLSGPNFAAEVARELPAGTTVAAAEEAVADFVQTVVMSERFRVWTSTDIIGVQLGGALKNIIAIGAGLSDGIGMGDNARAALITRGVAEITRLGVALGANPLTFAGVSGIGDIMLTCTGDLSRNRTAGVTIARGASPASFMGGSGPEGGSGTPPVTVEGIATTKAVHTLANDLGIDMPITEIIYRILYENLSPKVGVQRLMSRAATAEM